MPNFVVGPANACAVFDRQNQFESFSQNFTYFSIKSIWNGRIINAQDYRHFSHGGIAGVRETLDAKSEYKSRCWKLPALTHLRFAP
jgi:hypothetical protein